MNEKLIEQISSYKPFNAQEEADKALLLKLLDTDADLTLRENLAYHLTASAWVVSPDRQKVLMAYHNLYDSWAWLGGHADGDRDLLAVARKEACEESGITNLRTVTDAPISLEILTVSGHEKRGKYIPSHLHLNLTYLFEADPAETLRVKPDENSAVGWIDVAQISQKSTESWFIERIYSKLTARANTL